MLIIKGSGIEKIKGFIGEELFERQHSARCICIPVREDEAYFISFSFCDVHEPRKKEERICLYCNARDLVFAADNIRSAEILKTLPQNSPPYDALAAYFSELTAYDFSVIEDMENDINELELGILKTEKAVKSVISRIVEFRHALLRMKHYYEQLDSIIDRLSENEYGIIPPEAQARFVALNRRIHSLLTSVSENREYVTQAREAYQAKVDIEQNEIMKVFTVITAIFLPLTLIVGWYGMNFPMPELSWRFGYPYVILLSILVFLLCFYLFKKKKWF